MDIYIPFKKECVIKIRTSKFDNDNISNKVYFSIPNEDITARLFLDAIIKNNIEDAKAYISKKFADKIDLDAVTEIFSRGKIYKYISKRKFTKTSKVVRTNSVLVMENGISRILHLHMIQEPDMNSNWKIYGIEKE